MGSEGEEVWDGWGETERGEWDERCGSGEKGYSMKKGETYEKGGKV